MDAIKTLSLKKYYGTSRGIDGIDLTVKEGEFFGFIGPNGAGKSTTVRTLLGLISPTSGNAEIFGKDVIKHKTEILSEVGYMPS
ncbi:MAG: ATP-binding cassette domain-containing protein, partial [Acutalibacteraceae bacterium]|nr:ATP-binding cassette domain-containing protein [Acutalibacteraceae bacterium]